MFRGIKEEYDVWVEFGGGDFDWDWDGLLFYFKKVSCFMLFY